MAAETAAFHRLIAACPRLIYRRTGASLTRVSQRTRNVLATSPDVYTGLCIQDAVASRCRVENTEFIPSLTERTRVYTPGIKCIVKCASRFIITLAARARLQEQQNILARIPFRRQCVEHLEHVQGC